MFENIKTDLNALLGIKSEGMMQTITNDVSSKLGSAVTNLLAGNISGAISGMVSGVISKLGIGKTSTSLEKEKQRVAGIAQVIENLISMIKDDNASTILTEIEKMTSYYYEHARKQLSRRTWAPATTQGLTYLRDNVATLRNKFIPNIISTLENSGLKVSSTFITVSEQSLEDIYQPEVADKNQDAEINGNIQYRVFTITGTAKINQTGNLTEMVSSGVNKMGGGMMALIFGGLILGTILMKKKP